MQRVTLGAWACRAPLPHPEQAPLEGATLQFLFMVDGDLLPAHYGHGGPGPFDLAFGGDPPDLVARVLTFGTWLFTLDETGLTCSAAPAPGAARLSVAFEQTPEPIPLAVLEGTRALLLDQTTDSILGTFPCSADPPRIALTGLLPGHSYRATVSATGYGTETVTFLLPDTGVCDIMVALPKLVPGTAITWGDIKALYR